MRFRRRCPGSGGRLYRMARDGWQQAAVCAATTRWQGHSALAGLWEHWQDANGNELESCAILVRAADVQVRPMHDRMPVIVAPGSFDLWLDIHSQKSPPMETLLAQQAPEMQIYPVGRAVNRPQNDDESLITPLEAGSRNGCDASRLLESWQRCAMRRPAALGPATTYATIVPYTLEEAYEVADAIQRFHRRAARRARRPAVPDRVLQPDRARRGRHWILKTWRAASATR